MKTIIQIYPVIPATDEERARLRPIGRNRDLYHQVLHDWLELAKVADELGYWGLSTIEHHFHSEGFEVGPNPGIIDAWFALQTKNVRRGFAETWEKFPAEYLILIWHFAQQPKDEVLREMELFATKVMPEIG